MKWVDAAMSKTLTEWPYNRSVKNEKGDVVSTRDAEWAVINVLSQHPKTCKYLGSLCWNEDDSMEVYQVTGVGYVAYEDICGEISSFTSDPEQNLYVITTGDMEVFANHVLDREQREVFLEAMK